MSNVIVVVGMQFGDEGKGKVIDVLAKHTDFVVRFQGGNNAGHTVVVDKVKYVLHLLPSGAISSDGFCLIGSGVVVDLNVFLSEINTMENSGKNMSKILIDECAHVVMPYHIALDEAFENQRGANKIGTTLRGIGPAYSDKINRLGIRIGDLKNRETLKEAVARNTQKANEQLKLLGACTVSEEEIYENIVKNAEKIKDRIVNGVKLLDEAIDNNKTILLEGAQAAMLDIDHGTYPYVTSSSPTAGGSSVGSGIAPKHINTVIGVLKAYSTRVGEGLLVAETNCNISIDLRNNGHEYGATTGRARRTGWLDLVVAKHACTINGFSEIVLTKLDVLSNLGDIKVIIGYEINGVVTTYFPRALQSDEKITPIYETLSGWNDDLTHITQYNDLPVNAKKYIEYIQNFLKTPISMISVGPGSNQNIYICGEVKRLKEKQNDEV